MLAEQDIAYFIRAILTSTPVWLVLAGLLFGSYFEKKHLKYLGLAESELADIVMTNLKKPVGIVDVEVGSSIVGGQVVIANDALKSFLASFRSVFGGEMKGYERLMDRARREATVRMLTQAREYGYNAVCNIRVDFSCISSGGGNTTGAVEVLVTATAYRMVC